MRRVAVLGGVRIPFCRSHTAYAELSNLDMLTAALGGLIDRFSLHGAHIDEVVGGAVVTHAKDWNLAREAVIGSALSANHARHHHDAGLRHEPARRARPWRQDRHRTDRLRHCARLRYHERCADRVQAELRPTPGAALAGEKLRREARDLQRLYPGGACPPAAIHLGAAHRPRHGRALRADGQGMGNHPRGGRPARL